MPRSEPERLVGLDVGTSGVKALTISPSGEVLGRAERGYELSTPKPGWAEQDPEDWWRAAVAALDDVGSEPAPIGLSGQMHGLVVLDERERIASRRTRSLFAEAERWEPGAEGLLFQPYLQGERTPHADPNARGAFVGLSLRHDRGALVRAVLEGVAYGLRDSLELLRALGVSAEVGRVSGGGARSELWLKIVASALGLPLERTIVEEGAAYGAALLAGVKAGVFAGAHEAVAACVRVRDRVEPDPDWQAVYDSGFTRYRALYPLLRRPEP